jgi:hypothetical protein
MYQLRKWEIEGKFMTQHKINRQRWKDIGIISKQAEEMVELRKDRETLKAREESLRKIKDAEKEGFLDALQDPETLAFLMEKMKKRQQIK